MRLHDHAPLFLVTEQVREAEAAHRDRRRAAGKSVLGRQAVLAQKPSDSPQSAEPHFGICPRVATKSKWSRIEAIQRCKAFVERHKAAIKSWMAGIADVRFPYGTDWMRKFAHVLCDDAGST